MTNYLGLHVKADTYGSPPEILNDLEFLTKSLYEAGELGKLKIIRDKTTVHRFLPHGVTLDFPLEVSHMTVHTWPEYGSALVDILSCDEGANPHEAMRHILIGLKPASGWVKIEYRGVFDSERTQSGIYLPPKKHSEELIYLLNDYIKFVETLRSERSKV